MKHLAQRLLPLLLALPALGQGLILGAPAQGSSGGGLSTVETTGDGLSGDGSSGTPLAVAPDLERIVDLWAIDASGNLTVPNTAEIRFGEAANDVYLRKNGSDTVAIEGDGGGFATLIVRNAQHSGLLNGLDNGTATGWLHTIEANATTNTISASEASAVGGYVFTDDGTDNTNTSANNLPADPTGKVVRLVCVQGDANDILQATAAAGDTIHVGGAASTSGGNVQLKTSKATLTLLGINSSTWVSMGGEGDPTLN